MGFVVEVADRQYTGLAADDLLSDEQRWADEVCMAIKSVVLHRKRCHTALISWYTLACQKSRQCSTLWCTGSTGCAAPCFFLEGFGAFASLLAPATDPKLTTALNSFRSLSITVDAVWRRDEPTIIRAFAEAHLRGPVPSGTRKQPQRRVGQCWRR